MDTYYRGITKNERQHLSFIFEELRQNTSNANKTELQKGLFTKVFSCAKNDAMKMTTAVDQSDLKK